MGALFRDARGVGLDIADGVLRIRPSEHKRGDHFRGFGATPLALPASAPDEALGAAIREGLAMSR